MVQDLFLMIFDQYFLNNLVVFLKILEKNLKLCCNLVDFNFSSWYYKVINWHDFVHIKGEIL